MTAKKKPEDKLTPGAPTKYRPEFCEMLIEHMSEGLSFESFAGVISTTRTTLYNWEKEHPEFLYAKETGTQKSLLYWEKTGSRGMNGKIRGFNSAVWNFSMKNRFKWTDRIENSLPEDEKEIMKLAYGLPPMPEKGNS